MRELAVRQVAEQIALLMDQERELRTNIEAGVRQQFLPFLEIAGVQPIVAAGLIAELGMPRPGFGVPQIAVLAGVAPVEASSAGAVKHRLSRGGNRRLNMLLYDVTGVVLEVRRRSSEGDGLIGAVLEASIETIANAAAAAH